MAVFVKIEELGQVDELLGQIDAALRGRIARQAVKNGGGVVQEAAKALAPRSEDTGTRDHWSAKTEAEREGVKELADTIGVVVRTYDAVFVAVIGPIYPAGALGHLVEEGHALVAWGKPLDVFVSGTPFMEPAADQTKEQQQAIIVETVRRGVDEIIGNANL